MDHVYTSTSNTVNAQVEPVASGRYSEDGDFSYTWEITTIPIMNIVFVLNSDESHLIWYTTDLVNTVQFQWVNYRVERENCDEHRFLINILVPIYSDNIEISAIPLGIGPDFLEHINSGSYVLYQSTELGGMVSKSIGWVQEIICGTTHVQISYVWILELVVSFDASSPFRFRNRKRFDNPPVSNWVRYTVLTIIRKVDIKMVFDTEFNLFPTDSIRVNHSK